MDAKAKKTRKQIWLIFTFVAIYSLSLGLWENYKSVWLEANGYSISNLSLIISGGILLTALISLGISFFFKGISPRNIIIVCICIKLLSMIALACFFQKNISQVFVFIIFMIDTISGQLVVFSIYPLLSQTAKSNKIYSKRKLIEYLMQDVGLAVVMVVLSLLVKDFLEYNVILIISAICVFASCIISLFFKQPKIEKSQISFSRIFRDKILNIYVLIFCLFTNISYYLIFGMQALLLKNLAGLSMAQVSIFLLVASLCGDIFGYLALWKLTPKNPYITFTLKFVIRFFLYFLVACTGNSIMLLIAVFVSLLVSRAYENVIDAPYVNRARKQEQFIFTNYSNAIGSLGRAIGIVLSGLLFPMGMQILFGVGVAFMVIQLVSGYYLITLHRKDKVNSIIYSILDD